jgi:photosystem II stability/assembly factor-like uncharacterized protein
MRIVNRWVRVVLGLSAAGALTLGASWTEVDAGLPLSPAGVTTVVVDPGSPSTVYALGGSLFKSTDGGATWDMAGGVSSVSALVIDPSDSSTLYAVAHGTVVKSTDGTQSWSSTGFPRASASALAIDPQSTSTVYAASDDAIFKTTDGGTTWSPKTSGLPDSLRVGSLAIDATNPSTIYVTINGGIYKSADGGESWRGLVVRQSGGSWPVAIDPTNPSTVYAVLFTPESPGPGGNLFNLSKSTDGGENWSSVSAGIPGFVTSLAVDPTAAVYAAYSAGDPTGSVVKSTDGGASWSTVNTGLPSNAPPIRSLALNLASPATIFAGYFDIFSPRGGVFKTIDGGAHWNDASTGLTVLDVHALAIDPVDRATVYVAASDGVSKTIDGGADWTTVHFSTPGLGTTFVPSLLIDPSNPQVLYASMEGSGGCFAGDRFLRKSTDGGANWSDLGVTNCVFGSISLAIDPGDSNKLYAAPEDLGDCGTPLDTTSDAGASWSQTYIRGFVTTLVIDPANPATLYGGTEWAPRGVIKTPDGGKTWLGTALTDVDVRALAIDPANSNILYAVTAAPYPDGTPGLFKTTDGGTTWSAISADLAGIIGTSTPIMAPVIDPEGSVLYVGTSGSGVFKSLDGGASWIAFNDGLSSRDIRAIAVSSDGSGTLYAGTPGGVFKTTQEHSRVSRKSKSRSRG